MRHLSDRTVCEHLARMFTTRGIAQLMLTRTGGSSWSLRAVVVDPKDSRVRYRVRGEELKLETLLADLAEHVDGELAAGSDPAPPEKPSRCPGCGRVGHTLKKCIAGMRRPESHDDDKASEPDLDDDERTPRVPHTRDPRHGYKVALQLAERLGVVTIDSLAEFVVGQWNRSARETAERILTELVAEGALVGDRRGYRLPERAP